jgi:hypothetical protein
MYWALVECDPVPVPASLALAYVVATGPKKVPPAGRIRAGRGRLVAPAPIGLAARNFEGLIANVDGDHAGP